MNNKLFIFLVVVLSLMILASCVWLVTSINKYNNISNPKPTNNALEQTKEEVNTETQITKVEATKPATTTPANTPEPEKGEPSSYILPSDSKEIVEADLVGMDSETLNRAYNEIFARHGHDFKTESLKEYFN